jgi:hypothetical protein
VGWFVLVGHEIDGIPGRANEKDLEDRVPGAPIEGPENIDISGYIYHKIECLRFKRYARARLDDFVSFRDSGARGAVLGSRAAIEDVRLSGASYAAI